MTHASQKTEEKRTKKEGFFLHTVAFPLMFLFRLLTSLADMRSSPFSLSLSLSLLLLLVSGWCLSKRARVDVFCLCRRNAKRSFSPVKHSSGHAQPNNWIQHGCQLLLSTARSSSGSNNSDIQKRWKTNKREEARRGSPARVVFRKLTKRLNYRFFKGFSLLFVVQYCCCSSLLTVMYINYYGFLRAENEILLLLP